MRTARTIGVLLAAALPLAACGGSDDEPEAGDAPPEEVDWTSVQETATEEGSVVVYTAQTEDTMDRVIEAFEADNPDLSVEAVRMTAGDLESRVDQELAAGQLGGDVVWSGEIPWIEGVVDTGAVVTPAGPAAADWPTDAAAEGAVTASLTPIVVAYNTDAVAEAPTSFDDLLTPEFAGRVGLPEPAGTLVSASVELWDEQGILEQVAELDPTIYPTTVPLTQAVGSGEIAWALGSYVPVVEPLKASGAPIDWVVLPPGTLPAETRLMAMDDAPHRAAGQVFVDWIMTPAGQEAVVGAGGAFASVLPGIPNALEIDTELLVTPDWSEWQDRAKLDEVQSTFRGYFG